MKKLLAVLLLPILLALPISEASSVYFASQNCQVGSKNLMDTCGCDSMMGQFDSLLENSCCCAKSKSHEKEKTSLISKAKLVEFNFVSDFEFTSSFVLPSKINLIENYSAYYSAGFSTSEELVLYSPPIYQQICSLRI